MIGILNLTSSNYAPILTTLLGGIIGFGSSYYLHKRNRKIKKTNLRLALRSELKTTAVFFDIWAERVKRSEETPPPPIVSTVIFENNTDKIGKLTDEEMDAIVDYYSFIIAFENISDEIASTEGRNPYDGEMIETAVDMREHALRKIDENLDRN